MRGWVLGSLVVPAVLAQPPVGSRPFRIEELRAPPGFEVSVFARVSGGPRFLAFGPNGVLYTAARSAGTIVALPGQDVAVTVLSGLNGPHNLEFQGKDLYVADDDGVWRARDAVTPDLVIRTRPERVLALPQGGQHSTRTLGFGPDGGLYVTAGSTCNFCIETDPRRAAMLRIQAGGETIYARGLRNSVGFAWHPLTGDLWATENGGDGLGDDEPPEEINLILAGGDYGWPDCIGQRRPAPWGPPARPDRCPQTIAPELEMPAHSAPLGLSFYTGGQFPVAYLGDAFVAFHGSWNRNEPTGYKVIRVRAAGGRARGFEDFLWGFLDARTRTRSGRPVHAVHGPDGSLFVSDDDTGNVYRVRYRGPRINPGGIVRVTDRACELYGVNLTNDPAELAVYANGIRAEILYAANRQVNFLLPESLAGDITITLKNEIATDEATLRVE